jgi:hypothetical protein
VKRTAQTRLDAPSTDTVASKEIMAWARPRQQKATPGNPARDITDRLRVAPVPSDSDDSAAKQEFMAAMRQYKECSGRMFPTWSEVLEALQSLGYQKRI